MSQWQEAKFNIALLRRHQSSRISACERGGARADNERLLQSRADDGRVTKIHSRTANNAKFDPKAAAAHARVLQKQINPISSQPVIRPADGPDFRFCAPNTNTAGWNESRFISNFVQHRVYVWNKNVKSSVAACKNLIKLRAINLVAAREITKIMAAGYICGRAIALSLRCFWRRPPRPLLPFESYLPVEVPLISSSTHPASSLAHSLSRIRKNGTQWTVCATQSDWRVPSVSNLTPTWALAGGCRNFNGSPMDSIKLPLRWGSAINLLAYRMKHVNAIISRSGINLF